MTRLVILLAAVALAGCIVAPPPGPGWHSQPHGWGGPPGPHGWR